jgi:hypothetical protein
MKTTIDPLRIVAKKNADCVFLRGYLPPQLRPDIDRTRIDHREIKLKKVENFRRRNMTVNRPRLPALSPQKHHAKTP